jgi:hypothetical protein
MGYFILKAKQTFILCIFFSILTDFYKSWCVAFQQMMVLEDKWYSLHLTSCVRFVPKTKNSGRV